MNNSQIDELIKTNTYLGSFPYDEIPKVPDNDFSLVVNTESSTEPGEHWIAIVRKQTKLYFFDTYGRTLNDATLNMGFVKAIKMLVAGSRIRFNTKWLQQIMSNVCGDYCIYFINEMSDHGFKYVLSKFSNNLKANDDYILNYVNNLRIRKQPSTA